MKEYRLEIKIFLLTIIYLTAGTLFYILLDNKIEIFCSIIIAGISATFALLQYEIEKDKIFKELFLSFNDKYDKNFNDILNRIDSNNNHNTEIDISDDIPKIIDYINLCAEEYLWYQKGRIDSSVWLSWEKGMIYYFNILPINKIVLSQRNQKDSYYGLFEKIGNKINNWNTIG